MWNAGKLTNIRHVVVDKEGPTLFFPLLRTEPGHTSQSEYPIGESDLSSWHSNPHCGNI